jgi:hypothetical protein
MTRLRELFDEAAGTPPPHTLSADTVYAAGRRRRTLVTAARSALAVVTVAAVAGAAYGAVRVAGAAHVANGDTRTSVASLAVDGDHMYALVRDCVAPSPTRDPVDPGSEPPGPPPRSAGPPSQPPPSGSPSDQPPPSGDPSEPPASGNPVPPGSADPSTPPEPPDEINPGPSGGPASCRARLLGSDDAGRTWKVRSDAPGMDWIAAPRHGVLVGGRDSDRFVPGQRVSADGGRTWRTVTLTGDTVPAVPAGAYVDRILVGPEQKVVAVDPRTGRATPLASQPGFSVICVEANPAHSLLVATGLADEKTTQSAKLGVSRDGGRTWSTHPMPGDRVFEPPSTVDGTTLYQIGSGPVAAAENVAGANQEPVRFHLISVSTDGGATWIGRDVTDGYYVRTGFVTADGAHVVVATGPRGDVAFWVSRDKGATYQRQNKLPGLPASYETMYEIVPATGAYVARADGSLTFYRSTDGWNWRKVTVH